MEKSLYESLLKKIKIFENNIVRLPIPGEQSKHTLIHIIDDSEKFRLIINKKGHRNPDNLTILLNSMSYKSPMIRFDVNGSDHAQVPTPHLHIFTEEYDNGKIVIPLSDITNKELVNELLDSLEFFMNFANIKPDNVIIEPNLLLAKWSDN